MNSKFIAKNFYKNLGPANYSVCALRLGQSAFDKSEREAHDLYMSGARIDASITNINQLQLNGPINWLCRGVCVCVCR